MRKKTGKIAAALSSMALLGVWPFAPAAPAEAVTIVHDRPHQRGDGEFYRNTDPGDRPFSDRYGEGMLEAESDTDDTVTGGEPALQGEKPVPEINEEPKAPEPEKTPEMAGGEPETKTPVEKEPRKEKRKKAKAAKAAK